MALALTPKNCLECQHTKGCRSYYGGSMCKYKDEIYRAYMEAFSMQERGDNIGAEN